MIIVKIIFIANLFINDNDMLWDSIAKDLSKKIFLLKFFLLLA